MYSQPGYYIKNLAYEEYFVPATNPLFDAVYSFYEAKPKLKEVNIPVIPDGCIDMVISFSDMQCTGISICGTITSYYSMTLTNSDYIFGVRFKPGRFPFKTVGAVKEIVDNQQYVILTDNEWRFINTMTSSHTFGQRIASVSEFVGKMLYPDNKYGASIVSYTMDCINANCGNVSIKNISDELLYSTRYIEKLFKEYTGFTPKKMCKFARMHKAVNILLLNDRANHTDVSMECGYSDLSHMNRDLNEILGFNSTKVNKKDFFNPNVEQINTVYSF